jgi:hypothetical protein
MKKERKHLRWPRLTKDKRSGVRHDAMTTLGHFYRTGGCGALSDYRNGARSSHWAYDV